MKVLVTGHKGYIGSVLVRMLLERGHVVTGVDSDLYADCTYVGTLPKVRDFTCDIRDTPIEAVEDQEAIIHLAGLSNDPLGDYDPTLTESINSRASIRLAEMARQAGVKRFLFASSCSMYGASGNDFLDETAQFHPVTPYAESKVSVEAAVKKLANDGFSPCFIRASTVYGLSPRIRFDLVINNLVAWAYTTGQVRMKSDGTPWRPVVHVEDISLAYITAMEAQRELVHNAAFNVGQTTENYQVRELAELVRQVVPNSSFSFAEDASPDSRNYRVDCGLIARTLHGFKPQWTARRGVEQLYESFRQTDLAVNDFEGIKYKRIAHIKKLMEEGTIGPDLRRLKPVINAA